MRSTVEGATLDSVLSSPKRKSTVVIPGLDPGTHRRVPLEAYLAGWPDQVRP